MNIRHETGGERDSGLGLRIGNRTVAVLAAAELLVARLDERNLHVTTVESCTGGALAHFVTSIAGSSAVLKDAFVTYSTEAKIALGVPREVIAEHTVYSEQTALAMARAGVQRSVQADIGIGITGSLSREDPENDNSVPGEVYLGVVFNGQTAQQKLYIPETNRTEAKLHIVERSIQEVTSLLDQ